MWSSQGVADLKASLTQPGAKFQSAKREPEVKVYDHGTSLATSPDEPQPSKQQQQQQQQQQGLIPDNYQVDDVNNTSSSTEVAATGEIKKLVLDSGAFIMGANLTLYGPDCEYYTLDEVIAELKDENARHNFSTFPYPIKVKSPSPQSMQYIAHISRQTGDYHVLSAVDRKVLALAHQLEVETHGNRFIRDNILTASANPLRQSTGTSVVKQVVGQEPAPGMGTSKSAKKRANKRARNAAPAANTAAATSATSQSTSSVTTTTATDGPQSDTASPEKEKVPQAPQETATSPAQQPSHPATTTTTTAIAPESAQPCDPNGWLNFYQCPKFDLATFFSTPSPTASELSTLSPQAGLPSYNDQGYLCYPSPLENFTPSAQSQQQSTVVVSKKVEKKKQFSLPGFDDGEWVSPTTVSNLHAKSQMGFQLANAHTATISSLEATQLLPTPLIGTEPAFVPAQVQIQSQSEQHVQTESNADKTSAVNGTKATTTTPLSPSSTPFQPSYQQPHQHSKQPAQTSLSSVGCITVDYSMQNVMLQAGLRCLTLDGRAIATIRQYIMGCHACYTLSKDMSRGFCPSCGGFTMVRIIVNVDKNGKAQYSWPVNRIENKRGTIFQVSQQQIHGKKGAGKIIVREDMMPKPKLKQLLIARGEKADTNADKSLFDEAALFGFMRQYETKTAQFGFGKKNMNIARRRK